MTVISGGAFIYAELAAQMGGVLLGLASMTVISGGAFMIAYRFSVLTIPGIILSIIYDLPFKLSSQSHVFGSFESWRNGRGFWYPILLASASVTAEMIFPVREWSWLSGIVLGLHLATLSVVPVDMFLRRRKYFVYSQLFFVSLVVCVPYAQWMWYREQNPLLAIKLGMLFSASLAALTTALDG
jgi:hypothetical protein